jgi:hypothetical protein
MFPATRDLFPPACGKAGFRLFQGSNVLVIATE